MIEQELPDRRLHVCLVSAAYHPYPSGVSEHVRHLALALKELGQDVHVLTTNYPGKQDNVDPFPVTRLGRVVLVPANRSYATVPVGLRLAGQVKRFFAGNRFDVVHCHGMFWPEISYWAIRHSEAVHLVTFLTAGFKIRTRGAGLFRTLFAGQLRRIDGLVPISNRAWQAFQTYVPGKPRIIPCGVDLDRFRPDQEPLSPKGRPTVLFLGRLDGRKGICVLLRAMPFVLAEMPEARLVVVGTGPEETRARKLCRELGVADAVEFAGRKPGAELPRYYADCDVYCSPALGGETLGIVLLEAMASGAPVVCSNIPGYDETVEDGKNGILFPPGDHKTLAATLVKVLQDDALRRDLVRNGLERAKQYSWARVAGRTLGYYRELLASRPNAR